MNILLFGYYGHGNLGDEIMLQVIADFLSAKKEVRRIFIHTTEGNTNTKFTTDKIVFFSSAGYMGKLKLFMRILFSSHILWGGGTFIYDDRTNNDGIKWFYWIIRLATLLGKAISYLGVGVENIPSKENKLFKKAKFILNKASYIYVRENQSWEKCITTYGYKKRIEVGGDPVFNYLIPTRKERHVTHIRKMSFSGHFSYSSSADVIFYAKMLSDLINQFNCELHFIPAHNGKVSDNQFHQFIYDALGSKIKGVCTIHDPKCPEDYIEIMSGMDFHIGMRLHSVIVADIIGLPNAAIAYAPKIKDYINKTGILQERCFNLYEIIDGSVIQNIILNYKYPEAFFRSERENVIVCLNKVFH